MKFRHKRGSKLVGDRTRKSKLLLGVINNHSLLMMVPCMSSWREFVVVT